MQGGLRRRRTPGLQLPARPSAASGRSVGRALAGWRGRTPRRCLSRAAAAARGTPSGPPPHTTTPLPGRRTRRGSSGAGVSQGRALACTRRAPRGAGGRRCTRARRQRRAMGRPLLRPLARVQWQRKAVPAPPRTPTRCQTVPRRRRGVAGAAQQLPRAAQEPWRVPWRASSGRGRSLARLRCHCPALPPPHGPASPGGWTRGAGRDPCRRGRGRRPVRGATRAQREARGRRERGWGAAGEAGTTPRRRRRQTDAAPPPLLFCAAAATRADRRQRRQQSLRQLLPHAGPRWCCCYLRGESLPGQAPGHQRGQTRRSAAPPTRGGRGARGGKTRGGRGEGRRRHTPSRPRHRLPAAAHGPLLQPPPLLQPEPG